MPIDAHYLARLAEIDREAQRKIAHVSLVGEAGISTLDASNALKVHIMAHRHYGHAEGRRFTERYPSSLVVAIVDIAKRRYEKGGLWPYINEEMKAAGLRNDLDNPTRDAFRYVFIDTLRDLGLRTVGDGYEMVDTAAMHAGIPTYCLDDWCNLTRRARLRVGDDPASLTRWALDNRDRAIMGDIDQPIKRMLETGPEFAEELFERARDLLDGLGSAYPVEELTAIGELEASDAANHSANDLATEIGLSPRWVVMAARNLSKAPMRSSRASINRAATARPQVQLNFLEGEVQLALPSIADVPGPINWRIQMGEVDREVTAEVDLTGPHPASRPVDVAITSPARLIRIPVGEQNLEIELLSAGGLGALFGPTGRHRPGSGGVVAPGSTWMLLPADANVRIDGKAADPLAEDDAPVGWHAWSLRRFDLRPSQLVEIEHDSSSVELRVRGGESPEFHSPEPVAGARNFGIPICSERPTITFPPSSGPWHVSATRRGDSEPAWSTTADQIPEIRLLDGLFAQTGTFEVSVRGPIGRGTRETFALVDGLQIHSQPPIRKIGKDGQLGPAVVTAGAGVGIHIQPVRADLGSRTNYVDLAATGVEAPTYSVRYWPSTTLVAVPDLNGALRWGPRPVRIEPDELQQRGWLFVRLPEGMPQTQVHAMSGNRLIQSLEPRKSLGAVRFQISSLIDSAREHGRLELFLEDGQPVGLVAPLPKVGAITLSEGGGAVDIESLAGSLSETETWCWLAQAPWRPPVLLHPDADGHAELPVDMRRAGPLQLHTRATDPWVPAPPPDRDCAKTLVPCDGSPPYTDSETRVLAAARGEDVVLLPQDAEFALTLCMLPGWLHRAMPSGAGTRLRRAGEYISKELVMALASSPRPADELLHALVLSGLYRARPTLTPLEAAQLWRDNPRLGAIFAPDLLNGSSNDSFRDAQSGQSDAGEIAETESTLALSPDDCMRLAESTFGPLFTTLVETGEDPASAAGCFDLQAARAEDLPLAGLERLIAALALVPRGLLDADSRIQHTIGLALKDKKREIGFLPDFRSLMVALEPLIAQSSAAPFWPSVEQLSPAAPFNRHHWVPPFARAGALLARARNKPLVEPTVDEELHEALVRIASAAPAILLAELVRAEALMVMPAAPQTHGPPPSAGDGTQDAADSQSEPRMP